MTTSNLDDARVFVFVRVHAAAGRADATRAALSKVVTASRAGHTDVCERHVRDD